MDNDKVNSWKFHEAQILPRRMTVLVVEDDSSVLRLVKLALENRSFEVIECSNHAQAIDAIEEYEIAMAVVDLKLPDASGSLVLRKLVKKSPNTKIVIFTSCTELSSALEAIELKVFAFVEKSRGIQDLILQVEQASVAYLRDALSISLLENNLQVRLLDAMDVAAIAVDTKLQIVFANRYSCELFGMEKAALIGKQLSRYLLITDSKANVDRKSILGILRKIRMGSTWNGDVFLTRLRNTNSFSPYETFPSNFRVAPILYEQDRLLGYITVFSNLRNERNLSYQLNEQRDRLMKSRRLAEDGRLAGTIAHEINQPLGAISNYAGGLLLGIENGKLNQAKIREMLTIIQKQANRASQVIHRLREFLDRESPVFGEVEIQDLIRESLQLLHLELERSDIHVRTRFSRKPIICHCDPVQIQQVFVNVIVNAIDALSEVTDRSRELRVHVASQMSGITIQFIDNGPGIPEEELGKVFEPYYTTKPLGMGLGLCICREIVRSHQGEIKAIRMEPRGTKIEITLRAYFYGNLATQLVKMAK